MKQDQDFEVVDETKDSATGSSSRRRKTKKLLTKKLTLFNRLVRSPMFQFLVGNVSWNEIGKRREIEAGKKYIHVEQSLLSKAVDVILFSLLVIVAPFFAFNNLLKSYWARFSVGVLCGVAVLFVIYRIASVLWPQFANL